VPLLGLEQVNQQISNFDLIYPGQVIQVPTGLEGLDSCGDAFYSITKVIAIGHTGIMHLSFCVFIHKISDEKTIQNAKIDHCLVHLLWNFPLPST
jgi:hypothetical protein